MLYNIVLLFVFLHSSFLSTDDVLLIFRIGDVDDPLRCAVAFRNVTIHSPDTATLPALPLHCIC